MYTFTRPRVSNPRRRRARPLGDFTDILPGIISAGSQAAANIASIVRGAPTVVYQGLYPPGTGTAVLPAGSALPAVTSNPLGLSDSELLIGGVAGVALLAALMR